jgi:hypothetical protein
MRSEKWQPLKDELDRQRITEYELWQPVLIGNASVHESINRSQKVIVRHAQSEGWKCVCIFEDDIMFPAEDGWQYFLNNIPEKYDIYMGGNYLIDNRIEYVPPLVQVKEYVGNHCIIIHENYYDTFLSVPYSLHIDQAQNGLGDFWMVYPMAALQRPGWSSNNHAQVNYNALLKEENVYGKFR